jgi:hypothetical protein
VADSLDEAKAALRAGGGFMGNVEITALSRRRTLLLAHHGLAGAKIALYAAIAMSPKAPTRLECQLLLRKRGRKDFEYVQTQRHTKLPTVGDSLSRALNGAIVTGTVRSVILRRARRPVTYRLQIEEE